MRLYYITEDEETEITDVNFITVTRNIDGMGALNASVRDINFANISTVEKLLWAQLEVKDNSESNVLGEYFLVQIPYYLKKYYLFGWEGLRVLDQIPCRYNGILASGVVTAVGANYIDDSEAAFVAALETKAAFFTDSLRPSTEIARISHVSTFTGAPDSEIGDYEDTHQHHLAGEQTQWYIKDSDAEGLDVTLELRFNVTNHASAEKIEIELTMVYNPGEYYDEDNETPMLHLWDENGSSWKVADPAGVTGLGYMTANPNFYGIYYTRKIVITENISNYFAGTQLLIRSTSGYPHNSSPTPDNTFLGCVEAKLTCTYSTLFLAEETPYIIDSVVSATRLQFTGQTPNADGIGSTDLYRIGDLMETVAENIFDAARIPNLNLTFDATSPSVYDSNDYYPLYVGPVLRKFAKKLGRELFQNNWTINCKSSYVSTGLSLTEADFEPDLMYNIDGTGMISRVIVIGNDIKIQDLQLADSPSPQGLIMADMGIHTQYDARITATNLLTQNSGVKNHFVGTLDYEKGTDYSAIIPGKSITINLCSGKKTITNGLITSCNYKEVAGGSLLNTIQVKI